MHISLSMSPCTMSVSLLQPCYMRLNTSIFIFWIHKVCALIYSWKVFSSNFGKQTFLIGNSFSILDSWRKYQCLAMTSLHMFWCGISIKLWMSEWDCQNFEESKQDENSREPVLISLLLYTHFKININLDRMFWLYSLYSVDQLTCGSVASCPSQRPLLSGLG